MSYFLIYDYSFILDNTFIKIIKDDEVYSKYIDTRDLVQCNVEFDINERLKYALTYYIDSSLRVTKTTSYVLLSYSFPFQGTRLADNIRIPINNIASEINTIYKLIKNIEQEIEELRKPQFVSFHKSAAFPITQKQLSLYRGLPADLRCYGTPAKMDRLEDYISIEKSLYVYITDPYSSIFSDNINDIKYLTNLEILKIANMANPKPFDFTNIRYLQN